MNIRKRIAIRIYLYENGVVTVDVSVPIEDKKIKMLNSMDGDKNSELNDISTQKCDTGDEEEGLLYDNLD